MIRLDHFDSRDFGRGASAFREYLWWGVRFAIFSYMIPIPSTVKVALLRLFGAELGQGVVIRSRVNITFPWRFSCGDHVWIGDDVLILSLAKVCLGSHVCLSQRAFLCAGSHDCTKESFDLITMPIAIEDSCWIGANTFIGPGVTLRTNTVCGAGSVVMKDAGPNVLLAGNPSVVKKKLSE